MTDFKTMLAAARLPERTVPICLRGDLVADFEAAERDLEEAERVSGDSLEAAGTGEIAERMEALRAQMLAAGTCHFRLRALPKPAFKKLLAEHPPRKDAETGEADERDRYIGLNVDTFFPTLIRASVIDPQIDDGDWSVLLDEKLTDNQFDTLQNAAWFLNRGDVDVPFSRAASRMSRSSGSE